MKGVPVPRARRRRPAAAAAAYSHALAVTGDPSVASAVAVSALRRGAHSRIAVLAHARHQALRRADSSALTDVSTAVAGDVRLVAMQLAGSRPPVERAIVDLELRYGLDHASFARVLGLSAERAADRARSVAEAWGHALDPALMAWLGPGSCETLAGVLAERRVWPRTTSPAGVPDGSQLLAATGTEAGPAISGVPAVEQLHVSDLLDAAPAVQSHASTCEICGERLRMLTTVRTLFGQQAIETVPPEVAVAAKSARRRLAGALPPSIEPRRIDIGRARSLLGGVGVVAGIAVAAALVISSVTGNGEADQDERVARLLESAPTSRLLGTPTIITPDVKTAALANNGAELILWHADTSTPWLTVDPADGRLAPSQMVSLAIDAKPPTVPAEAVITITGSDGSRQTLRYVAGE